MKNKIIILVLNLTLLICCSEIYSADFPINVKSNRDEQNIYIPADLKEVHSELLRLLPKETIEKMRSGTEDDMSQYHFGPGMWMRNNWGFRRGSRLAKYFNGIGIRHPDDMSGIILGTFWCKLNDKPFRLNERIEYYQEYWRSMEKPKGDSPKDGAKINWVATKGKGKGAVHLGISVSDRSYWRYEYGNDRGIEPATEEDTKILDMVMKWRESGVTKPEDFKDY